MIKYIDYQKVKWIILIMKLIDHILYSKTTKIAILLVICLAIGFIAPAIINIFLDFAPPSPYVAGTCHIKVGMRANCFPEVDAKNQVNTKWSFSFQLKLTWNTCCSESLTGESVKLYFSLLYLVVILMLNCMNTWIA